MKWDEFAFVNEQLAGMLKTGIPLEGALRQLCATMQRGQLRVEFEGLESDLAQGKPLASALAARKLPPFYVKMVAVGVAGNDLPEMLTMLADHYRRWDNIWTRLKGVMVYPAIVLASSLALLVFLSWLGSTLLGTILADGAPGDFVNVIAIPSGYSSAPELVPAGLLAAMWAPVAGLALVMTALAVTLCSARGREWLGWRIPAFREAGLARFASAMRLMLGRGGELNKALEMMQELEGDSRVGGDVRRWRERLAAGHGKFAELAAGGAVVPPLFVWLVAQSGEDLATGFGRAAEIYQARSAHRVEMMLYGALPAAVLALGLMIVVQIFPIARLMGLVLNRLGT